MKKNILSLVVLTQLALTGTLSAQITPSLTVQGSNATLRWASTPGESYVVLYRRAFHDDFPWIVLQASVPASGGGETSYQHLGGVPRVPAEVGGGGSGVGGGSPPVLSMVAPSGGTETKDKDDKVKSTGGGFPALPTLPDEKEIEQWLKQRLKEYERMQREGGTFQPVLTLMASSITAEQATNTSMGFYVVLDAAADLNDDGVPDGLAAQFGLNPLNDLSQTDSDNDNLTDLQEIVLGTNPADSDTDGDGASDYEEVYFGSDPKTPQGLPGITGKFHEITSVFAQDGYTWTNYLTHRFEWGLRITDSNHVVQVLGNGEVGSTTITVWPMQYGKALSGVSSNWTDLAGGGKTNLMVTTDIPPPIAPPPYDGFWRRGAFAEANYISTLQMTTHGTDVTQQAVYEIQLSAWTGAYADTEISDFSGFTIMGEPATADGKALVMFPQRTLTNLSVGVPAQYAQLKFKATPTRLPIDIQEVTSDQIAGSECNKLPTAYFAGELNNPMLMATRSGTDARIAVKVAYAAALRTNVVVGVRKVGNATILASAPAQQAPDRTLLQFTAENGSQTYEVVAGYDYNSNGALDAVEVNVVFSKTPRTDESGELATKFLELVDKFIVVTKADYDAGVSASIGYANYFGTQYAGDLIRAFVTGSTNITNATLTSGLTISATTAGMAHPLGGKWDSNCEDITYRLTFEDGTPASNEFESSSALAAAIDQTIYANIDDLLLNGSALSVTTREVPISHSADFLITEGKTRLTAVFGKVTFGGPLLVDYVKASATAINVTRVRASGSFDDVYDFAYGAKPVTILGVVIAEPKQAARVQAGHATLSTPAAPGGKVFYTRLVYDTGWFTVNLNYSK